MKLLISSGGTGGHVFPALALAGELKGHYQCSLMFAAGNLSKNPYFESGEFLYQDISCSQMGMAPWRILKGSLTNVKGVIESIKLLKEFNPDAVVGFGSYYTFPVLLGALYLGIPVLLHEANSIPGRVNRLLAPFAKKTWTYFPATRKRLKGEVEECKMPLRFKKGAVSKREALEFFGLKHNAPVLLIFGGSQGAKGINALFSDQTIAWMKKDLPDFQIIHFTGSNEAAKELSMRYQSFQIPSYVKPFEKRIDFAWTAADIAVTRAGASSIAEQMEFGIPGIVFPYPHAKDDHQNFNADHLSAVGLGVKLAEQHLEPYYFAKKIIDLFQNKESAKNQFLGHKMQDAAQDFSSCIMQWLEHHKGTQ